MNQKELKKVVKHLEIMGVKLKPTQVVDLTLTHLTDTPVETIKVKRPVGRPKGSVTTTSTNVVTTTSSNSVSLPEPNQKPSLKQITNSMIKKDEETDNPAKYVLAKMVKEPIDDYDKIVFTYLMDCKHNISERGLALKLNLTGDDIRLTASLYKGMNRKIVDREKLKGTYLYFTVAENMPILQSIIGGR